MTMRVVTQDEFGGPGVLHIGERPMPEPIPTEVRVRVRAAGVNPVDWKTRRGKGMAKILGDPPFVLGWDVAGVVDAVGTGLTRFAVGDRVLGMPWFPRQAAAYAEYVTAPARQFVAIPDGLDDLHAGALPLAGLTAWHAVVEVARIQPGQRLLIQAAAGGVGHLAVQIAKACGAYVIGTASAAKHDLLTDLGVDEPIDYHTVDVAAAVRDADVVIDCVGGQVASQSLDSVRWGGLLISVPSAVPEGLIEIGAARNVRVTGMLVEPDSEGLRHLTTLIDEGRLQVIIEQSFPLDQAGEAHALGETGRSTGKIVLAVA